MTNFPLDTITLMRTFRKRLRATSTSQLQPKTMGIRPNANTAQVAGWSRLPVTRATYGTCARMWRCRDAKLAGGREMKVICVLHGEIIVDGRAPRSATDTSARARSLAEGRPVCISHFLFLCGRPGCVWRFCFDFLTMNRAERVVCCVSCRIIATHLCRPRLRHGHGVKTRKILAFFGWCWRQRVERVAADFRRSTGAKKGNLCISVDTFKENLWQLLLSILTSRFAR